MAIPRLSSYNCNLNGYIGVQPHVVPPVLNHISGRRAGVAGIYNRASYRDEKKAAPTLRAPDIDQLKRSGEH